MPFSVSLLALIHEHSQREISQTPCLLVSYTTLRCGMLPCYCSLARSPLQTHGENSSAAAVDDGHVFDSFSVKFLGDACHEQIKVGHLSFQKIRADIILLMSWICLVWRRIRAIVGKNFFLRGLILDTQGSDFLLRILII